MPRTLLAVLALAVLLTACAEWQRGAYEGLRKRDEITTPPGLPERTAPPPDYDTYRKDKP